jgi:hypothetical protein
MFYASQHLYKDCKKYVKKEKKKKDKSHEGWKKLVAQKRVPWMFFYIFRKICKKAISPTLQCYFFGGGNC